MKHFNLSANTHVFFHSGEQCDFFMSHSKQVCRQIPQDLHSTTTVVLSSFPFKGVTLEWLRINMAAQAVLW